MKKINKAAAAFTAALIFTAASAAAEPTAQQIEKAFTVMEATDNVLAFKGDYSATISIQIEKPGKPNENLQYKIFQRTEAELMTIVQLFPEADKGNGYLMDGDNIWAYDPISRKFTHTSLKEALGDSDLKIDDIDRSESHWRDNYNVTGFEETTLGRYEVYKITLDATSLEPSYARSVYYVRKDLNLILKVEDFSATNRLMRTTLMPKYTRVPAGYVPTQIILRDEINQGESTQEVLTDLTFDPLPDTIFTKAYLEGLN